MSRCIPFILLLLLSVSMPAQHRHQYSQYMFNGLAVNPGYAGSSDALNLTLLHRNQWLGFDDAPQTTTLAAHMPLRNQHHNAGINLVTTAFGVTRQNSFTAIYAYRLMLGKSSLTFGMQGGVEMNRINWDNVRTVTAGDMVFSGQSQRSAIPVAGAGLYFRSKNLFAGVAAPSLIQTGDNYQPLFVYIGGLVELPGDVTLKPSVLTRMLKNSPAQVDANLTAYYKNFGLGASWRSGDAFVALVQYDVTKQFRIGYAYDLSISQLKTYHRGSHEIMLRYEFGYTTAAQHPRYF